MSSPSTHREREDAWLWGWDPTPGIVSVSAEPDGRAIVWRRRPRHEEGAPLVREDERFRPWLLLDSLTDLRHLGPRLRPDDGTTQAAHEVTYRELTGPGALRFQVFGADGRMLTRAVLDGATARTGRPLRHVRELGPSSVLFLPPEEQYLVSTGRTYFRGLGFDDLRRTQFDLETTGLDPDHDRIFLVALRGPDGRTEILEARGTDDLAEAALLSELCARIQALDPDVIENHNLHGFDLPFVVRRAELLRVPLRLGRVGVPGVGQRASARGTAMDGGTRKARYTVAGRELIDTLDAVIKYDFSTRELPGHGLKAVARHLGLAGPEREHVPGARVYEVYRSDPERVRRYARDDVNEAAGVARLLGGSAFALATMAPRRYERLSDAGAATGVLDPLLVRAYLREGAALPAAEDGDGTLHEGAALHVFATGVATNIVKADVASLYPSLMREYRIGPARDRLGVLLTLVDRLVELRLEAKGRSKTLPAGSAERHTQEAMSAAMKIVINSAYGYLGAVGLTRFADVHAANEVTRRGRELLGLMCQELSARGVTLLEADTDGVYFAVPEGTGEAEERRIVTEVAGLLPAKVHLELEGRYAAMLSHEAKNYALAPYGEGRPLILRGVAFRSRRTEPYGETFLRRAIEVLLKGDVKKVHDIFVDTVLALRGRKLPTAEVCSRVRLTRTPAQYQELRGKRKELPYEAVLASGRTEWHPGERVRVYRARGGSAGLWTDERENPPGLDTRDYDVEYYVRLLRETFSARLTRALEPEAFASVFADPEQPSLFASMLEEARPILTVEKLGSFGPSTSPAARSG